MSHDEWLYLHEMYTTDERIPFKEWKRRREEVENPVAENLKTFIGLTTEEDDD